MVEFAAAAVAGRVQEALALLAGLSCDERAAVERYFSESHAFAWSTCRDCGAPIFRHYAWSHQGGTPPTDHVAEPPEDGG